MVTRVVHPSRNPVRWFVVKEQSDMVHLLVKPDPSVRNYRTEEIAKFISSFGLQLPTSFKVDGRRIVIAPKEKVAFRIVYQKGEVSFYFVIPRSRLTAFKTRLESLWERITIDEVGLPPYLDAQKSSGAYIHYLNHDIFSVDTDHHKNAPLSSLISPIREFKTGDVAIMDVLIEPRNRGEWEHKARRVFQELRQGKMPKKLTVSNVAERGFEMVSEGLNALRYTLLEMTAFTKEQEAQLRKQKKLEQMDFNAIRALREMKQSTKDKQTADVLKVSMRAVVQSEDIENRNHILQSIAGAWHDIDGDNELTWSPVLRVQKLIEDIDNMKHGRRNIMSTHEVGKLIQLPGDELQRAYKEINAVRKVEVQVSEELFQDKVPGITIGKVTEKGITRNAKIPYAVYDGVKLKEVYDALCTAVFGFGKVGVGKTDGIGAGHALDMIKGGLTAFLLDTADGQVAKTLTDALPEDYPEEKLIYLDFRNVERAIPLTYADVAETVNAKNGDSELAELQMATRLTAHLQEFLNKQSFTGALTDRMRRYFVSAAKATRGRPLYMILALESPSYREELLRDPFVQSQPDVVSDLMALQDKASSGADRALIDPIIERLGMLSRNPFLANVFLSDDKRDENGELFLNFRRFADNPEGGYGYCVVIVCDKDTFGPEGQEIICSTIQSKIFLSAYSRIDQDQSERKPFISIADEPHRFIRGGAAKRLYSDAAVELRKYRCRSVMLAHSPDQLGEVWDAFSSGGAQIIAYKSENMNDYKKISQQLAPYDADYVYQHLPEKWEAVCKLRLPSGKESPAFFAQMATPPEPVKDRQKRRDECGKIFGHHWKDAMGQINELRSHYLELDAEWLAEREQLEDERKQAEKERKAEEKKQRKQQANAEA